MNLLVADLRCLDAHAHLGNLAFDHEPEKAIRHYEVGRADRRALPRRKLRRASSLGAHQQPPVPPVLAMATVSASGGSAASKKPMMFLPACSGSIRQTTRVCAFSLMTCARERLGMSSGWSSSETLSQRKQHAPELRAHNGKTRTHCGTMESSLTFPQFHSAAATQMVIYMIATAPKRQRQKQRILLTAKHRKEIMENGT